MLKEEPKQIQEKEMRKTEIREERVEKSFSVVVDPPPQSSPDTALFMVAMKKAEELIGFSECVAFETSKEVKKNHSQESVATVERYIIHIYDILQWSFHGEHRRPNR